MIFHSTTLIFLFFIICGIAIKNIGSSVENNTLQESAYRVMSLEPEETLKQLNQTKKRACSCANGLCSCCSRLLYENWKQRACVNVTYDPDEFSFTTNVIMNDRILYTRTISGKNPEPMCVPVPRIPTIRACVRLYNIYFQGRNVHACVNMEGKFRGNTVFKIGLDCIRLGANGVAVLKPEDGGGLGQIQFLPATDDNDEENDDYDDDIY